ncbi:MAG: DHHW family protein [Erysipelotrichaceae bacterium]|nr:DHHW family protein [Erysipelotrichaceae bacterium]
MNFTISDNYKVEKIVDFLGVYAGQLPIKNDYESINILVSDSTKNSKVYNYENNKTTDVYDLTKKDSIDKYDIYLSGAVPLITITNDAALNDRELIVFRDSYGSSLVPLFTSGYKKITVVDTRYISPKILDQYIGFNDQDVLFLYSTLLINNSSSLK